MDSPAERARAQTFWRRQLQLSCLAGGAFVSTLAVTGLVVGDWGRDPDNHPIVVGAVLVSALMSCAVLVALVVHALRVATFTFRRGDN